VSRVWFAFFVFVVVLQQVALGQTESASRSHWNASASASFLHVFGSDFDGKGTATIPGWRATVSEYPYAGCPWAGGMAQVSEYFIGTLESLQSVNITSNSHQFTFMMGPSVAMQKGRIRPFADVLIGVVQSSSSFGPTLKQAGSNTSSGSRSHLGTAAGSGVDFVLSSGWSLRANANWLRAFYSGNSTDFMEASAGVVFRY
jgi:hypothetical protein